MQRPSLISVRRQRTMDVYWRPCSADIALPVPRRAHPAVTTSGLWANQWQLHVDPLVSNVHVTVDQPSLPSQPVPYDLWPCAAFRSQIRSQQSAQQLRPPRGETSNHHDAQHSQLDDWGVHRKACPSLELVVQQSILYCDTTRG